MKVCEICGDEIYTRDGENRCRDCDGEIKAKKRKEKLNRRRERDDIMRSIGLVKVRGALGGVYYE